ncbi:hypothetical protein U724_14295 [Pseudomonas chlororaphis subsp. aurantiaca PB-St2]|nr:hypothetical protein U724_14295 [Pseudomonas chlororaphis subsp. aurantiaca PB-St2]
MRWLFMAHLSTTQTCAVLFRFFNPGQQEWR